MTAAERAEQIARYRNMVAGDPDDDLATFRLGQVLMEDEQHSEAVKAFERVFQFLGECLIKSGDKEKATEILTKGWLTANERGDRLPMEGMGKLLTSLGAPIPKPVAPKAEEEGPGTGFRCQRPGCMEGKKARQLPAPPLPDALGERIYRDVCAACWTLWFKDLSIKLINEHRLDLSSDFGQSDYDHHMRDFMGFEEEAKV
jgi:Fe-S cluster biosynthesis and repair protein YggX